MPSKKYDPMSQKSEEGPQSPEDARAPGYDNNTREAWLTGKVQATEMPFFDKSSTKKK
jgi:hypothetical protein